MSQKKSTRTLDRVPPPALSICERSRYPRRTSQARARSENCRGVLSIQEVHRTSGVYIRRSIAQAVDVRNMDACDMDRRARPARSHTEERVSTLHRTEQSTTHQIDNQTNDAPVPDASESICGCGERDTAPMRFSDRVHAVREARQKPAWVVSLLSQRLMLNRASLSVEE